MIKIKQNKVKPKTVCNYKEFKPFQLFRTAEDQKEMMMKTDNGFIRIRNNEGRKVFFSFSNNDKIVQNWEELESCVPLDNVSVVIENE